MNRNNHLNSLDLIAPLNRLNKVFFGIFGTLLFISVVFWVYTNVFVPNQLATIYSNKLPLSNGQSLIIAYPNHIPCDQKAYPVKLITTGMPVNAESPEYIISIPNNLMVTFPTSEAFKTEFIIENQPSYIFRVRNTCTSFFRKTNNTSIQSDSFLGKKTFIIPMHVECKFNTIFRLLANTSVDRNNTIIIIITGLLSAAGFMVTQLVKAYWMEREINEKIKERLASSVQDFKESLIEDPIRALSIYTTTEESEEEEEYLIRCRKIIERRNLIEPFSLIVIDHLKHREWDRAQRILNEIEKSYQNNETFNVLCELTKACQAFTTKNLDMGITLDFYVVFFAYRIFGEKIEEEIKNILLFFCSQQETIIKTQKALEKMEAEYPVIFQAQFVDNIQLIVSSEKFIELTSTEELSHEIKEAIERIKSWPEIYEKYITLPSLWQENLKRPIFISPGLETWLTKVAERDSNKPIFHPFMFDKAELDFLLKDYAIELPILYKVQNLTPTVVFGVPGSGKTALAFELIIQTRGRSKPTIYPLYIPVQANECIEKWLLERIASSVSDLVISHPQVLLKGDIESNSKLIELVAYQQSAFNRLAIYLKSNYQQHPTINLLQSFNQEYKSIAKVREYHLENAANLLCMAGFDNVFLLLDFPNTMNNEILNTIVERLVPYAFPLAQQGIYLKFFIPDRARGILQKHLERFEIIEIIWDQNKLKELLERRQFYINKICNKGLRSKDPLNRFLAGVETPRQLIQRGQQLLDYAEKHLGSNEKFSDEQFSALFPPIA